MVTILYMFETKPEHCINVEKSKQTDMKQREQLTSASWSPMIHPLLMGSAAAHFFLLKAGEAEGRNDALNLLQ